MRLPATVTSKMILKLIEGQSYQCALSGRKLTPETASLDHIVPLSRGGEHSIENLWVVDVQVNAAKGTLTTEEFQALCQEVVEHQPMVPSRQAGQVDAPGNSRNRRYSFISGWNF